MEVEQTTSQAPSFVSPTYDLEGYIQNYSGHTRINRLLFIAEKSPKHEEEAVRMALENIRTTQNTTQYREIVEKYGKKYDIELDENWISVTEQGAERTKERLENELNSHKNNFIKESIRLGYDYLGEFLYDRGDLSNALKAFVRTRDYCITPQHIVTMCLNVIRTCLEMKNFTLVTQYVNKAESIPEVLDPVVKSKLHVASGLAQLDAKRYKQTAQTFLDVNSEIGSSFSEVISPTDIAIYGSLFALATFDRYELRHRVLDNSHFKNFLELVPDVRDLLYDFYSSKYASCLRILDNLKPDFELDYYLSRHIDPIYEMIRNKALIQYTSPFSSVDLNRMAVAFNTDVQSLQKELEKLIMDGLIQARIDSHNKVLHAQTTNQREKMYEEIVKYGRMYVAEAESLIRRMNIIKNDLNIKPQRREGDS